VQTTKIFCAGFQLSMFVRTQRDRFLYTEYSAIRLYTL
jgi:hypothetical protein